MRDKAIISIILIILSLLIPSLLKAERATWQAPLVYYPNFTGPYVYESEAVTTEGLITSITANWDFSGKVHLEVSANNGQDYCPIINGVPLDKGFIPGDHLRYKAFLGPNSKLSRVTIFYKDTSGIKQAFGNPQLSDFKFRKAIDIVSSAESDLFNYQIQIKIGEGASEFRAQGSGLTGQVDVYCDKKIEADFKDVRFTCADGETTLAYYLESITGTKPNRIATFWVKIPQIPRSDIPLSIYLYYDNKDAEDLSSAENVFDFFDEFSEKELNLEKWEVFNELKGEANIENGELKLKNSKILSRNFKLLDGIIEFKARIEGRCALQGIIREKKEEPLYSSINQTIYSSGFSGAEHTIAVGDMVKVNIGSPISENETYVYRIIAEGLNLNFERYNAKSQNKEAELHFMDIGGLTEGHIGLKGECAAGNEGRVHFYWIRVRKYTKVLPKVLVSYKKEEKANLAQFSGIGLSPEGKLIIENNQNLCRYESITIPIGYSVRIMAIESKFPLNISADGGRSYKRNTENKKYYYASLGDFAAGERIKWKMEIAPERKESGLETVFLNYYPGVINLISPNAGEELIGGSLKEVLWSAQEYEPKFLLKLEYSLDKGKTYKTIVGETPNTGSFYWRLPEGVSSQEALIKISDALACEVYDTSDGTFSIILR